MAERKNIALPLQQNDQLFYTFILTYSLIISLMSRYPCASLTRSLSFAKAFLSRTFLHFSSINGTLPRHKDISTTGLFVPCTASQLHDLTAQPAVLSVLPIARCAEAAKQQTDNDADYHSRKQKTHQHIPPSIPISISSSYSSSSSSLEQMSTYSPMMPRASW